MPLSKYYSGSGDKVMQKMKRRYGTQAKRIFYARANKAEQQAKRKPR